MGATCIGNTMKQNIFKDLDNFLIDVSSYIDNDLWGEDAEDVANILGLNYDMTKEEIAKTALMGCIHHRLDSMDDDYDNIFTTFSNTFSIMNGDKDAINDFVGILYLYFNYSMNEIDEQVEDMIMSIVPEYIEKHKNEIINGSMFLKEFWQSKLCHDQENEDAQSDKKQNLAAQGSYDYGF